MSKKFLTSALIFVLAYAAVGYNAGVEAYAQTSDTTLTVTDIEGTAIQGAKVFINASEATTDGSGIAGIGSINETDVYNILIFANGYNSESQTIVYQDVEETNNVEVQLNQGEASAIRSRITDAGGQPIAEASLTTMNGGDSMTDTNGYGHITGLHEGKYTVIASKEGYNTYYSLVTVTEDSVAMQPISLTGSGEEQTQYIIKGRVTSDLDNNGVEGVTVQVGEATAESDRYGYYAIGSFMKDAEVTITVDDPKYKKYTRIVTVGTDDVTENIALNAYLPVTVTVKDSLTGNAISDAKVLLNNVDGTTDITGKTTVGSVWAGAIFNMVAYADGYNPKTAVVTFSAAKPSGAITIELDAGTLGAIISKVTAAEDEELPESSLKTLNGGSSIADTSGLCIITGLPEGKYTAIASKTGYNPNYKSIDVTKNGVVTVPFELSAAGEDNELMLITGRVTSSRTDNDMDGVTITDGTNTSTTDLNGYYAIGYYDGGAVALTAKYGDFYDSTEQVTPSGETTTLNFSLDRDTDVKLDRYIFGYTDGTFRPSNKITRAEAAQVLYSLYGNNSNPTASLSFNDIPQGAYFTTAIKFVVESDYMTGYGDGTFRPYNYLNRQELAVIIDRIKKYNDTADIPFTDVKPGHWAEESIKHLYANNVAMGYTDNTFKPTNPASRVEMIAFIARAEDRHEAWLGNRVFSDVSTSHYGYNYIMNAANGNTKW